MSKYKYRIVGMKDPEALDVPCSFGVVLEDEPEYEGKVLMYENFIFDEKDGQTMLSVGFCLLEPGGVLKRETHMNEKTVAVMTAVIKQISNEIVSDINNTMETTNE